MKNTVTYLIKPKQFIEEEQTLDMLKANDVRVQYLYCGLCGGDYSCFLGRRKEYPYSLGHEFVAQITAIGNLVSGFRVGDLVVSDFNYRCQQCVYCKAGKTHLCVKNNISLFTNRGFAQYGDIHFSYLHKLTHVSPRIGILIEPLSCVLHAIDMINARFSVYTTILINGCGSIGTLFAFVFHYVYPECQVFVEDINENRKNNVVNAFGAIQADAPRKYDLIIECTNDQAGMINAFNIASMQQNMCIMTHLYGEDTSFVYELLCKKEILAVFPLRNGSKSNLKRAEMLLAKYWKTAYNKMIAYYSIHEINSILANRQSIEFNKIAFVLNEHNDD